MAAMYACYHGPDGLRQIARRVHSLAVVLARGLERMGYQVRPKTFFDTIRVGLGEKHAEEILSAAETQRMNFRAIDEHTVGISVDETTTEKDLAAIWRVFNGGATPAHSVAEVAAEVDPNQPLPMRARASI